MQEFIINLMNNFGYGSLFLLIMLENIFPPIPSEVILTFAGYMTTYTNLKVSLVIIIASLGSLLGAFILYQGGRIFHKDKLIKIVSGKLGKFLHLNAKDIEEASKWFLKNGQKSVFVGRFIPIIRSLISIPAGITKMNWGKFLIYTFLGSLLWNTLLIILGRIASKNWKVIVKIFNTYSKLFLILLLILIFLIIGFYMKKKKKQQQ